MRANQQVVLIYASAAGLGLFIAWLAYSLAPMWSISGGPRDNQQLYIPARVYFYGAFVVTSVLIVTCARLVPTQKRRPIASAALIIIMTCQLIAGILGWTYKNAGNTGDLWITLSFVLSGVMAPLLQVGWSRYPRSAAIVNSKKTRLLAIVSGLLSLGLLSIEAIPNVPLHSLLPLGSLTLLMPSQNASTSTVEKAAGMHATGLAGFTNHAVSYSVLAGIFCTLASAHVFNGAAEFSTFLEHETVFCAILFAALLGGAIITINARHRIDVVTIITVCTVAIIASIAIQGIVTNALGSLGGPLGRILHATVLVGEYLVYALGLFISVKIANAGLSGTALILANGGVSIGAISGILVTADILAYTVLSLTFSAAALLLLGVSWGVRFAQTQAAGTPPPTSDVPYETFGEAYGLSEREQEVFRLWATGHQVDYIAEKLCISKNTVKTHVAHIYKKTSTKNREDLIQLFENRAQGGQLSNRLP